jgi:hypothetical protein
MFYPEILIMLSELKGRKIVAGEKAFAKIQNIG